MVVTTGTIDIVAITITTIDMSGITPFVITIDVRRVIAASRSICAVIMFSCNAVDGYVGAMNAGGVPFIDKCFAVPQWSLIALR